MLLKMLPGDYELLGEGAVAKINVDLPVSGGRHRLVVFLDIVH